MKNFKRLSVVLSLVLCVTMLFSGSTVFAMGNSEKEYKVSYSAREEKSVDGLLKLAFEQQSNKKTFNAMKSQDNMMYGLADNQDESNGVEVKQLLEERVYKDGSVQRDYVSAGLSIVDKDGVVVPLGIRMPKTETNSWSEDGVSLTCSLYYTVDYGAQYDTFRVDKVVSTVSQNTGGGVIAMGGYHNYNITKNNLAFKQSSFTCNGTLNIQSFTMVSSHTGFYRSSPNPIYDGTTAQSVLRLSNGSEIDIQPGIYTNQII